MATDTLPERKTTDDWPRFARPLDEFWDAIGVGPRARHNLRKMGMHPEIIEIPGSYVRLVTREAEEQFIQRLADYCRSQSDVMEAQKQQRKHRNGRYKGG